MSDAPACADVFVERIFEMGDTDVACRFFHPSPDGSDVRCDYEISWPSGCQRSYGMGVDGVQALVNAMIKARCDLLASSARGLAKITWLGREPLGLPASDGLLDEQV
jgi:hypothetical protein